MLPDQQPYDAFAIATESEVCNRPCISEPIMPLCYGAILDSSLCPAVVVVMHEGQRTRMPSAFKSSQVIQTGSMLDFLAPLPSRTLRRYIILCTDGQVGAETRVVLAHTGCCHMLFE